MNKYKIKPRFEAIHTSYEDIRWHKTVMTWHKTSSYVTPSRSYSQQIEVSFSAIDYAHTDPGLLQAVATRKLSEAVWIDETHTKALTPPYT